MSHLGHAKADPQRRRDKGLDAEQIKTDGSATDIDDRVNSAHFMKVNLLNRLVVHARFSFGQPGKNQCGAILYCLLELRLVNDLENVAEMPVRVLVRGLHSGVV